jgi:hypothetical protein
MSGLIRRARIHPFAGESAPSLVIRAASLFSPVPSSVIAGLLGGATYAASSLYQVALAHSFGEFLGVPESEILRTMIYADQLGYMRLGSFSVQRTQVASGVRRTCPRLFIDDAPGAPPYDRLVWCIGVLDVDPDTGYPLIDVCPACSAQLLWSNTVHLDRCGSCGVTLSKTCSKQKPHVGPALSLSRLFASDAGTRASQRAQLTEEIRTWAEVDIISIVACLSKLIAGLDPCDSSHRLRAIASIFDGHESIVSILSQVLHQHRTDSSRCSDAIAYARLHAAIRRNVTERAGAYLSSLVECVR